MVEYYGRDAICRRMNWRSHSTLYHAIKYKGFPAYKVRKAPYCLRTTLYVDDELIVRWQLALARELREELLAREAERRARRPAPGADRRPAR